MSAVLTRRSKRAAKDWLKRIRRAYGRRRHAFSQDDFVSLLGRLGVNSGDVLMVHSSFDRFEGFTGKPMDVIFALMEIVGPSGTILMPTLPFTGSAMEYVAQPKVFDVLRTPSKMGLLTELFRRTPGVLRSLHPTHPVAVWGAKAKEMIAGHHSARTPCGEGTPFARLLDHEGKMLFLGTGIGVMTFFHLVEELLAPKMPFTPFTRETFCLESRDSNGRILVSSTYLFDPKRSRSRNLNKLIPLLKKRGAWREKRVGKLNVILLGSKEVLEVSRELANKGVYCYEP